MEKIDIIELCKILDFNIKNNKAAIEINFYIENDMIYTSCWLGKLISKENEEVYWLGLTENGTEAYDFNSKENLFEAKVFKGKNLKEVWNKVIIITIDSCDVKDRLEYYVKDSHSK